MFNVKKISAYIAKHSATAIEIFVWAYVAFVVATIFVTSGFRGAMDAIIPVAIIAMLGMILVLAFSLFIDDEEEQKEDFRIKVKLKRQKKKMILERIDE